jgi:hypothetical protein
MVDVTFTARDKGYDLLFGKSVYVHLGSGSNTCIHLGSGSNTCIHSRSGSNTCIHSRSGSRSGSRRVQEVDQPAS